MNIRKPTDYVTMFTTLDTLMAAQLPQMELYCEIGRVVSGRAEKGAAKNGRGTSAPCCTSAGRKRNCWPP